MWDDGWGSGWHHGDDDDYLHLSYPEQSPAGSQQQGLEEAGAAEQQPSLDTEHGGGGAAEDEEEEGGDGSGGGGSGLRVWRYYRQPPSQASHRALATGRGVWSCKTAHLPEPTSAPPAAVPAVQDELAASGWGLGVPPVVAPQAHYSCPQDAPAHPTVFAGREFR
jgi:hypothetical protein